VPSPSPAGLRVALLSPAADRYSETFIDAHRRRLGGEVLFYHGGSVPCLLEGEALGPRGFLERVEARLLARLPFGSGRGLDPREHTLAQSFRHRGVDVALAEFGPTGVAVLPVCRSLGIPLVVHFHGFDAARRDVLERHAEGYRALFAYAARIVVVSRPMEDAVRALGAPDSALLYNPCGPDEAFFDVQPRHDEKALLFVGRFVDKKAPYYTLLAFHEALVEHPDATLCMAGEGPLRDACRNLAKYLGIEDRVDFPGVVTHPELRERLATVRAVVQHSVTAWDGDMEGSPVALMEAGAAGVPVVSTRHAGIPEIVDDGCTGFLVEEHDVHGMAREMGRLLANRELARRTGRAARARMREHFPLQAHIDRLDRALMEVVSP